MTNFNLKTSTKEKFSKVLKKVKKLLDKEGFGVLSDINIKKKIEKKTGNKMKNYRMLGACNPEFANSVLQEDKSIGLFLPCSVVVYEQEGVVYVEILDPVFTATLFNNEKIAEVSADVQERLKNVIDKIGSP